MAAIVTSVSRSNEHTFTKTRETTISLIVGLGVIGDAHMGETAMHRSHIRKFGHIPNLRQVHLIHEELFEELRAGGFNLQPGSIGENVTTRGIDLLSLPTGTRLRLGAETVIELTGLRNPCRQIEAFQTGLLRAVLGHGANGNLLRKAGVMAVVTTSGEVRVGDEIAVTLPVDEHRPLTPV